MFVEGRGKRGGTSKSSKSTKHYLKNRSTISPTSDEEMSHAHNYNNDSSSSDEFSQ